MSAGLDDLEVAEQAAQRILEAQQCGRTRGCTCQRSIVRGYGNTHCVAHNEDHPSLTVDWRHGRLLVQCKTGCTQEEVIAALVARDLWPYGTAIEMPTYDELTTPDPDPPGGVGQSARVRSIQQTRTVADRKLGEQAAIARESWQHTPDFALAAVPYDPDPVCYAWALWEHKTGLPRHHWESLQVTYDAQAKVLVVGFGTARDVLRYRPWPPRKGGIKYFWDPESRLNPPLWPVPAPEHDPDIWIVGGETDAATMRYCGYRAYATTHGESSVLDPWTLRTLVSADIRGKTLHFFFDLEPSSEIGSFKNALAAHRLGIPCKVPQWPAALRLEGAKDANDVWHGTRHDKQRFRAIVSQVLRTTPVFTPETIPVHVQEALERTPNQTGHRPLPSTTLWRARQSRFGSYNAQQHGNAVPAAPLIFTDERLLDD